MVDAFQKWCDTKNITIPEDAKGMENAEEWNTIIERIIQDLHEMLNLKKEIIDQLANKPKALEADETRPDHERHIAHMESFRLVWSRGNLLLRFSITKSRLYQIETRFEGVGTKIAQVMVDHMKLPEGKNENLFGFIETTRQRASRQRPGPPPTLEGGLDDPTNLINNPHTVGKKVRKRKHRKRKPKSKAAQGAGQEEIDQGDGERNEDPDDEPQVRLDKGKGKAAEPIEDDRKAHVQALEADFEEWNSRIDETAMKENSRTHPVAKPPNAPTAPNADARAVIAKPQWCQDLLEHKHQQNILRLLDQAQAQIDAAENSEDADGEEKAEESKEDEGDPEPTSSSTQTGPSREVNGRTKPKGRKKGKKGQRGRC